MKLKWKRDMDMWGHARWIARISAGDVPLFAEISRNSHGHPISSIRNSKFVLAHIVGYDFTCQEPPKTIKAMKEIVEKTIQQLRGWR